MIDLKKMTRIIDFLHEKDWAAAHAMLDENESADPNEATVAHWRAVVLRDEGRCEEALQYLADNLYRFDCKSGVFHKRAELFHQMGNDSAALVEIEKAPLDSEMEDHWALVVDAKFFRLYLMTQAGLPISLDQWMEIPDDYISLMPTGERVSKGQLTAMSRRR
jgi:hypothetical protein